MILKKVDNEWYTDNEIKNAPFTRAVDALYDENGLGLWFKLELEDGSYITEVKTKGNMYTGVFFIFYSYLLFHLLKILYVFTDINIVVYI